MISQQQTLFHVIHAITQGAFCIVPYLWFYEEVTVYTDALVPYNLLSHCPKILTEERLSSALSNRAAWWHRKEASQLRHAPNHIPDYTSPY